MFIAIALSCIGGTCALLIWMYKKTQKDFTPTSTKEEEISEVDYMPNVTLETVRDVPQVTDLDDSMNTEGRDLEEKHNLEMNEGI